MVSTYREAYKSLDEGDPYFAAKKFLEAEILYPQSLWAAKSALMAGIFFLFTKLLFKNLFLLFRDTLILIQLI